MSPFSSLTLRRRVSIIPAVNSTSRRARGFTLIELLVVISVVGTLLAFFIPTIVGRITTNARRTATLQEMRMLRDVIAGNADVTMGGEMVATGFKNDVGRLPRHLIELATNHPFLDIYAAVFYVGKEDLPAWDPYLKKGWNGPYVREDGKLGYTEDAWDHEYRFYVLNNETLGLQSAGPDQMFLGELGARDSDDITVRF